MTKRDSRTPDLFEVPQETTGSGSMAGYSERVAHLVSDILKNAPVDRFAIAAAMSRISGKEVSKYMLDAWSAESRENYNIPFYLVPSFEAACESHVMSKWLADERGGRLLVGRDALTADLGRMERAREQLTRDINQIKKVMREHE